MGCAASRAPIYSELEIKFLMPAETALALHNYSSRDLDNIFHRYSSSLKMSQTQIARAFNELKIDYSSFSEFYNQFTYQEALKYKRIIYNSQIISTLGILLGKSFEQEKKKLLFQNYDIDSSKMLSMSEIKTMVTDILIVCLKSIPNYASILYPKNTELNEYNSSLESIFADISWYFIDIIMENNQEIKLEKYLERFDIQEIRILVNPQLLRQFCYKAYNKLQKNKELVEEVYEKEYNKSQFPKKPKKKKKLKKK